MTFSPPAHLSLSQELTGLHPGARFLDEPVDPLLDALQHLLHLDDLVLQQDSRGGGAGHRREWLLVRQKWGKQ